MCQSKIDELRKQILSDNNLNQQILSDNLNQQNSLNKEVNLFDSPKIQDTSNLNNNSLEENNTQIIDERYQQQIKESQLNENKEEEQFERFNQQNFSLGDQQMQEDNESITEVPVEESFDNFERSSFDNLNQTLESHKNEITDNKKSTLFPSSITITKMNEQNKAKISKNNIEKVNIDDVSNFLNYLNETKDALDIIDRLDFKMQQNKLIYNQQLENIKKTIENHSDSEGEDLIRENNEFDNYTNLNEFNEIPLNYDSKIDLDQRGFNLDSVLNKMQQIQNSAETRHHGSLNKTLFNPSEFSNRNQLEFNNINQLDPVEFNNRNQSIENDFLSKFGLQITVNKVLSYKDKEYFLSPPSFTLAAEDLLEKPGRNYRPDLVCVILRYVF